MSLPNTSLPPMGKVMKTESPVDVWVARLTSIRNLADDLAETARDQALYLLLTANGTGRTAPFDKLPVLEWGGCLPVCSNCQTVNIYLRKADGSMFRFKMTPEEALCLAQNLLAALETVSKTGTVCPQCGIQSSRSSGSPQVDGSPQEGQSV